MTSTVPERLSANLFQLMQRTVDLLDNRGRFEEAIEGLSVEAANLIATCEPAAGKKRMSWNERIMMVRSLDRSLALLSVLDGELEAATGCLVFDSLAHQGAQALSAIMVRMRQLSRTGSRMLFTSGPLVNLTLAGAANVDRPAYSFGAQHEAGRRRLLGGVSADILDLIDDLVRAATPKAIGVPSSRARALQRNEWQNVATSLGFQIAFQTDWVAGPLVEGSRFAAALGIDDVTLSAMRAGQEVLAVRWWDGTFRYPLNQLDDFDRPRKYLAAFLDIVHSSVSRIALAVWLSGNVAGSLRFKMLDTASGLQQLHIDLQQFDMIRDGIPPMPMPSVALPDESDIEAAYGAAVWFSIPGDGPRTATAWRARPPASRPAPPAGERFRITSRTRGPFFFASILKGGQGGGRFDLSDGTHGTCYVADSEEGAYGEVFRRLLVLDTQEAATRLLWRMRNFEDVEPLLDMRAGSDASRRLGTGLDLHMLRNRADTQEFASQAHRAGYKGILHQLARSGETGVSLFGKRGGAIPERQGLGSWHATHELISDREGFWSWLAGNNPIVMMNQMPLRRVV